MRKLPFLISIPHGGTNIPHEVKEDVCITPKDLFDDSDTFTQEIFSLEDIVEAQVASDIARAFVDMSRSIEMIPPEHTDGLIKSATCYMKPIYKLGKQPNRQLTDVLIRQYYNPYHQKIEEHLRNPEIILGIDCHSMAEFAPVIAQDSGKKRPLVNLGDADGKACDPDITKLLRKSFIKTFELNPMDVTINDPFKGGYITRKYGNNPKPWIQIELNRKLYLAEEYFDEKKRTIPADRTTQLNDKIRKTLLFFFENLNKKLCV